MKTIIVLGVTIGIIMIVARRLEKRRERQAHVDEELDKLLAVILGDCLEAYCEDCDGILAQGTGQYKEDVFTAAYNHGEVYDHEVRVRSWLES